MQYFKCKCSDKERWTSGMPTFDCQGCSDCGTTFAQHPLGHKPLIPHDFTKIMYNQNTGKPYKLCSRCHEIDKESYNQSKIKDNEKAVELA